MGEGVGGAGSGAGGRRSRGSCARQSSRHRLCCVRATHSFRASSTAGCRFGRASAVGSASCRQDRRTPLPSPAPHREILRRFPLRPSQADRRDRRRCSPAGRRCPEGPFAAGGTGSPRLDRAPFHQRRGAHRARPHHRGDPGSCEGIGSVGPEVVPRLAPKVTVRPTSFDASRRPSGRARMAALLPGAQALSQWERVSDQASGCGGAVMTSTLSFSR